MTVLPDLFTAVRAVRFTPDLYYIEEDSGMSKSGRSEVFTERNTPTFLLKTFHLASIPSKFTSILYGGVVFHWPGRTPVFFSHFPVPIYFSSRGVFCPEDGGRMFLRNVSVLYQTTQRHSTILIKELFAATR
jgi:hypothetical protein